MILNRMHTLDYEFTMQAVCKAYSLATCFWYALAFGGNYGGVLF